MDRFICWCENFTAETNHVNGDNNGCDTLCLEPPNYAIDRAKEYGLFTVDYDVLQASDAEDYMAKVIFHYKITNSMFNIFILVLVANLCFL